MSGLNGCLPKGANNLCNLLELQIDFRCNIVAYSYDISKMYNSLRMKACSQPFQLFLWKDELEETNAEQIWVFVVAIYGTLTSGNQATSAIRQLAETFAEEFPRAKFAIVNRTYVDDGMGGGALEKEVDEIVQEVREVLSRGGFLLKVVTRSGVDPDPKASKDGVSVGVGGYRWSTKEDKMGLGMGEVNFHRKV